MKMALLHRIYVVQWGKLTWYSTDILIQDKLINTRMDSGDDLLSSGMGVCAYLLLAGRQRNGCQLL